MKFLPLIGVYMVLLTTSGSQWLKLPLNVGDKNPVERVSIVLTPISVEDEDGVPTSIRPTGCQIGLFEHEQLRTVSLHVDYKLEIVNKTDSPFVFKDNDNLDGYFSLELDVQLTNGCVRTMRRKMPSSVSQRPTEVVLQPERRAVMPVSVDRRLWNGLPSDVRQIQSIRPRFRHFHFKVRDNYDQHVGMGANQQASHVRNELVGKWIRFKNETCTNAESCMCDSRQGK